MKKKLNVLLIIAVSLLWGTVIYRYVSNFFPKSTVAINTFSKVNTGLKLHTYRDTFLLRKLDYDPFGQIISNRSKPVTPANYISKKPVKKTSNDAIPLYQAESFPPEITYYGYIKSENKEFAILKLNNKIERLAKGQIYGDIVIKSFSKKDLTVSYKKQELIFDKVKN